MRLLVVLPTYNERENIELMLDAVCDVVPTASVLVVDDNSPDGTGEVAEKYAKGNDRVTVLHRDVKAGLGSAYRFGFEWGIERGYDALVEMDCDFSHDPAALPAMVALAERYDLVVGSRYVPGGTIPNWPLRRQLLSRGGNRYAALMLGLGVADSTAGYRVYRASALTKMRYQDVHADGYGFQVEMTYRARRAGASIVETPISFTDRTRGQSKMSGYIVVEALWLVTRLGLARPFQRGSVSRSGSPSP
jgi:dolichol-phosphate mannosyltransferase